MEKVKLTKITEELPILYIGDNNILYCEFAGIYELGTVIKDSIVDILYTNNTLFILLFDGIEYKVEVFTLVLKVPYKVYTNKFRCFVSNNDTDLTYKLSYSNNLLTYGPDTILNYSIISNYLSAKSLYKLHDKDIIHKAEGDEIEIYLQEL